MPPSDVEDGCWDTVLEREELLQVNRFADGPAGLKDPDFVGNLTIGADGEATNEIVRSFATADAAGGADAIAAPAPVHQVNVVQVAARHHPSEDQVIRCGCELAVSVRADVDHHAAVG